MIACYKWFSLLKSMVLRYVALLCQVLPQWINWPFYKPSLMRSTSTIEHLEYCFMCAKLIHKYTSNYYAQIIQYTYSRSNYTYIYTFRDYIITFVRYTKLIIMLFGLLT